MRMTMKNGTCQKIREKLPTFKTEDRQKEGEKMKVKNERQISLEVNEEALYSLIAHEIAKKYLERYMQDTKPTLGSNKQEAAICKV